MNIYYASPGCNPSRTAIMSELALTFPESLGVGRSTRTEEAMAWYWKGKTLLALGNKKQATAAWKNGAATPRGSDRQNQYINSCVEQLKK